MLLNTLQTQPGRDKSIETRKYKCNISILTEFFIWQLRWKSFSVLYARNNKYIRATIILWNLKGWQEIPWHNAPTRTVHAMALPKVKSNFITRLPRLGTASCLCSDSLYFLTWAQVLFPGVPKHSSDALSRLVLFSQFYSKGQGAFSLASVWRQDTLHVSSYPFIQKC